MSNHTPVRKSSPLNPYNTTPSKPTQRTQPRHSTPLKTPLTRFAGSADTGAGGSPSNTSKSSGSPLATPKKKRFVRKQPLKDRILQWPANTLFRLYMDYDIANLLESPKVARPVGLLLHFLSFLLKYATISKEKKQVLKKGASATRAARVSAIRRSSYTASIPWIPILAFVLVTVTAVNTYTLLNKFRTYRMFMRRDPLSSPNARKVQLDLDVDQSREGTPELERKKTYADWMVLVVGFAWKYFILLVWRPFLMLIGVPIKTQDSGRMLREGQAEVYQIDMWDINEGSLALFEVYSPAHALCWIFVNASNWFYLALIMVALWSQIHILADKYSTLVKDKLLVQGEVMHEYNESFVHPRVFKATRDASVQADLL